VTTPRPFDCSRNPAELGSRKLGSDLQSEHERYLTEEDFKRTGHCHGLSRGDQGLLHAAERG